MVHKMPHLGWGHNNHICLPRCTYTPSIKMRWSLVDYKKDKTRASVKKREFKVKRAQALACGGFKGGRSSPYLEIRMGNDGFAVAVQVARLNVVGDVIVAKA